MYSVGKQIAFSYGHRLLKHPGKCKHLHGHNAVAEIHCETPALNPNGMVVDFDDIRSALKGWIDANLDHRMILGRGDALADVLKQHGEPCFVIDGDPTAEAIAKTIFDEAVRKSLPVRKVVLWETPGSFASYER